VTSPARNEPSGTLVALAVGLVATTTLILHARSYPSLTYDDAFISLRYAQRLLEGHGLSWTEGPPVEGYSNLLWILGCALLGALGVDLVDAPVVLGLASAVMIIAALVYAYPPRAWSTSLPAFAGGMFIALAGPIGLWAVSGLEGCMVGALLAWSLVLVRPIAEGDSTGWRSVASPGIPLALLCLTRPDGPLVVVAVCGFFLLRARSAETIVRALAIGVLPGLVTLGQIAFRLAYYGDWLPNTARAKVAFTAARLQSGMECVAGAGVSSYALWVPATVALYVAWRDPARRPRILLSATLLAVWTAYSATVTCQPFGYRMLIPCYVLLAFLVADALDWAQEQGRVVQGIVWLATLGLLFSFGRAQQADKNIAMVHWRNPPVTRMAATIGNTLREAFGASDPLVAVDAAGAIPFFSGLRSIDMLGLNDAHIARHHDASFGHGVQGHELGDGAYVLSREPDLIVANVLGSSRLAFRGGRELDADPRFHALYRRVRMRGEDPVPTQFNVFCRLDGRVGVQRSEGSLSIPGHLFASVHDTRARLDPTKTLGAQFETPVEGALNGIELAAGTWHLRAEGTGPLHLSALRRSDGAISRPVADGIEIKLETSGSIDVAVAGSPPAFLTRVVARRVDE
jgi:arabinofuranosyltransferase